ncbi:DUF2868 domain-containing protein [Massilia sp. CF038]|uniref:DUF2868 domain-containing protein n=1 Tax=Massilia sp. CF038 TaxID=1881045 RepID=UPI0009191FAE|nr:DUF2868 domain-containing protein [Massilia sp. CF038]SHH73360.1 Protein of unknown function [Massilia sp. CF038]
MNEQVARAVVLVRAIETADVKREVLSADDRKYASSAARELAQWQASESGSAFTREQFLEQRCEQVSKRLAERFPALGVFFTRRSAMAGLALVLPVLALLIGAGLDRIGDPHRVDLLSAPLICIIVWNLAMYLFLVAWRLLPSLRRGARLIDFIPAARLKLPAALPRKLPQALAAGLAEFILQWNALSARLNRARLARTLHLAAAMFAAGAMLSLYARGLLTEYRAGWESTFLDAAQVHAILSALFAPALKLLPLHGFSLGDIESLRFSNPPSAAGGARWVHLYAATLFLLVVVPRLVLALLCHWRARALQTNFPIDLGQPYFRRLDEQAGLGGPALLRVIPYSFTLDEGRQKGLSELALKLYGDQARVLLRPPSTYGEEPEVALREVSLDDPSVTCTIALFNLAATPEKENHGTFLDYLVRHSRHGVTVMIDESTLLDRSDNMRLIERISLWLRFCEFHGAPATVVNLAEPERYEADQRAGLRLSKIS